jgi:hypothetical protein
MTLKWDYGNRTCDISMPGYISNVLSKFQHDAPKHPQHTPSSYFTPVYGAKTQYATKDETLPLTAQQCLTIQKVTGSVLYYARAVDPTVLMPLNDSGDAGFHVARSLKEFIATARESDKEFSFLPLNKEGNNICRAADVLNTKDGIGNYYRHVIKFNNMNGSTRIRTLMDIGKLKQAGSAFQMFLQSKRVSINKA